MGALVDDLMARSARLLPRPIAQKVAYRYVAGETLAEALATVARLNRVGCAATIDVLGESITDMSATASVVEEYKRVLAALDQQQLRAGVSVKLSAIGLGLDDRACREHLESIVDHAAAHHRFVRVDMENSPYTEATLNMVHAVHESHANVGAVVQAYLRRSLRDVERLAERGISVRLCKGIYNETRHLAYKDFDLVRANYLLLLERLLRSPSYVAIATHDEYLVWNAIRLVSEIGRPADSYEFQMLLGVDEELRGMLLESGYRLRVYVPYGKDWYAYSMRRLRESPKMAGYIAKEVFKPRVPHRPGAGPLAPAPPARTEEPDRAPAAPSAPTAP